MTGTHLLFYPSYNKHCPGDSGSLAESQNQARYCAAYSTAVYIPKTESYTMPAIPTLMAQDSYPSSSITVGSLPTGQAVTIPKLEFPSGHLSKQWNPAYLALLLGIGLFL